MKFNRTSHVPLLRFHTNQQQDMPFIYNTCLFALFSIICVGAFRLERHPFEHFLPAYALRPIELKETSTKARLLGSVREHLHFNAIHQLKQDKRGRPLMIIPSLIGNQLYAELHDHEERPHWWCYRSSEPYQIWFRIQDFLPYNPTQLCTFDNLSLQFKNGTYAPPQGVDISSPFFAEAKGVACLDEGCNLKVWKELFDELANGGYKSGIEGGLTAAVIDWRKGPSAYYQWILDTKDLVEKLYKAHNNTPVVIATLSYGGPLTWFFLSSQSKEWRAKYIYGQVSLAAAYGGSTFGIASQISSNIELYKNANIDPVALWKMIRNWGSISWLWPRIDILGNRVVIKTATKEYTMSDYVELANDAKLVNGAALLKDTVLNDKYTKLDSLADVKTTCVFGVNVTTPITFVYGNNFTTPIDWVTTDGDGTVELEGLKRPCVEWGATIHELKGVEHSDTTTHPVSIAAIINMLYET